MINNKDIRYGTYVNDQHVTQDRTILFNGDVVFIFLTIYHFVSSDYIF